MMVVFLLAIIAIILLAGLFPKVAEALAVGAFWIVVGLLGFALALAIVAIVVGLPVVKPHEWWAYAPVAIIVFGVYREIDDRRQRKRFDEQRRLDQLSERGREFERAISVMCSMSKTDKEAAGLFVRWYSGYRMNCSAAKKAEFEDKVIAKAAQMAEQPAGERSAA